MCRLSLFSILVLLTSCATPEREFFSINGSTIFADQQKLEVIRGYWKSNPHNLVQSSKVPQDQWQWILDLISLTENLNNHSCTNLTLVKITPEPLIDFAIMIGEGERKRFTPKKYLESWQVDACGTIHRWRVLDDPTSIKNEIAVLLYASR